MEKIILKANVFGAELTDEIKTIAEKIGIVLPSTHTAIFKTIYAEIEEANDNNVRLSKEAVEKALPGLVGSQVNLEHLGKGFMVGIILDASINDNNEIETVFTFAKNIYEEDYIRALEKLQEGSLSVSFELLASREGQEFLSDGTVKLHDIDFQGQGLLIDSTPAYKKALVYDMAKKYKQRAEKESELVYASKIVKACDEFMNSSDPEIVKISNQNKEDSSKTQGGKQVMEMTEEQKKLVTDLRAELGDFAKDVSDEELLNETKVDELRKASAETKEKELAYKTSTVEIRSFDLVETDGVETITENIQRVTKTDWSAMQEAVAKVQQLEETLKAKDSEIESVRQNAQKIGQLKVELKDNPYVADFKDEDYLNEFKIEQAKIKKENDDLKKENEELAKKAKESAPAEIKASEETKDELKTGFQASEEKPIGSLIRRLK